MNATPPPATTPEQIHAARVFLARVVKTPMFQIRLTGNPATDTNADLVKEAQPGPGGDWTRPRMLAKLDPLEAIEIDAMLSDDSPAMSNPEEGLRRFAAFLAGRVPLYT